MRYRDDQGTTQISLFSILKVGNCDALGLVSNSSHPASPLCSQVKFVGRLGMSITAMPTSSIDQD